MEFTSVNKIFEAKGRASDNPLIVHISDIDMLDDLVKEINISKFYLSRHFKSTFNVSPHKYITNVRFKRAKELIQFSDLQIQEISFKMNFESPQAFTRWFKGLDGNSPIHYRNNKIKQA